MKTFLIVSSLLMTGASVFGIVDYNKKAAGSEFKELYKESPAPIETGATKAGLDAPIPTKNVSSQKEEFRKTENAPIKKDSKKKVVKQKKEQRKFRLKEFSRSKLG